MKPPRAPTLAGIAIGLAAALLVLGYVSMQRAQPAPTMFPDEGSRIRAVVMQYANGSEFVAPVFRQYLQYQSPDVTAYVACPEPDDFARLQQLLGSVPCHLVPVFTHHPMTAWSRDRWVALKLPDATGPTTLLSPKGENGQDSWPARAGDSLIGQDLAHAFPAVFTAQRSGLFFDGGDFLADGPFVFVTRALLERNLQHTVTTREKLLEAISRDLHLQPVLLEDGPPHHAGMFMMSAGTDPHPLTDNPAHRVMLVADPSRGQKHYIPSAENDAAFTDGPDFSPATQQKYDSVAAACRDRGYRVERIPVVPAKAGKMYMTYVNVILDRTPAGKPLVYMSTFAGQDPLNRAAAEVWRSLGYEVRPIDCTPVWQAGGTLHCLVNVLQREP